MGDRNGDGKETSKYHRDSTPDQHSGHSSTRRSRAVTGLGFGLEGLAALALAEIERERGELCVADADAIAGAAARRVVRRRVGVYILPVGD
jgi:NAD(P)H-hydrate repair Nnr-like enzyme with NAD(P)H-hydrate dehydratase domain